MGNLDSLKRLAESLNKKQPNTILPARREELKRIRTGSFQLDVATGGGIPVNRVTLLFGEKSSGKTATAYRAAGQAQKLCSLCYRPPRDYRVEKDANGEWVQKGTCDCYAKKLVSPLPLPEEKKEAYQDRLARYEKNSYEPFVVVLFDVEACFDASWGSSLGLDYRVLMRLIPSSTESLIDTYTELMETQAVDMMLLDSLAAAAPEKELTESVEAWQQGLQARLLNKFCRMVSMKMNETTMAGRSCTHVWITQMREKIGVMFGDNTVLPGGKGQRFITSVEIKVWSNGLNEEVKVREGFAADSPMKLATQARVNFKVVKNKTAPPQQEGSYVMFLSGPHKGKVRDWEELFKVAEHHELVKKDGSKWVCGMNSYDTKSKMMEALLKDASEQQRLYQSVMQIMLKDS